MIMVNPGVGMSREKVSLLNRALQGEEIPDFELYGVRNIKERLQILLKEDVSMIYESSEGEGTRVTISIPETADE